MAAEIARKTIVVRCIDCKSVIGTEMGRTPKTESTWTLCQRCVMKRNGMVGAKCPNDLGIY